MPGIQKQECNFRYSDFLHFPPSFPFFWVQWTHGHESSHLHLSGDSSLSTFQSKLSLFK